MRDDKNFATEELIRKALQLNSNAVESARQIIDLENDEPLLFSALSSYTQGIVDNLGEQYPLIKRQQPRILLDFLAASQLVFIKGYILGRDVMRDKFDGFFEEINSGKDTLPEEDIRNFY